MIKARLSRRVFGFDQATIDAAKYGKLIGVNFCNLGESVLIASMDAAAREANKEIIKLMEMDAAGREANKAIIKIMESSKCP